MGDKSKISWTDATWNPVVGCTKVSEGCAHCYAERDHNKRHKAYCEGKLQNVPQYAKPFNEIQLIEKRLWAPIKWKNRPRKIFVNSLSDLFHEQVPDEFIDRVFAIMYWCPEHTFQLLTKRPDRMIKYLSDPFREALIEGALQNHLSMTHGRASWIDEIGFHFAELENLIVMTTAENQKRADERLPLLIKAKEYLTKCKLGVSIEPMLGPVDLTNIKWAKIPVNPENYKRFNVPVPDEMWSLNNVLTSRPADEWNPAKVGLDWVICGGESGPNARPMHPDWARSLRDQCTDAGVPFFFKQWGEYAPFDMEKDSLFYKTIAILKSGGIKTVSFDEFNYYNNTNITSALMTRFGTKKAGNLLDGQTWQQMPEVNHG